MHGQAASVHIIRPFAEQVEHLRVRHADEKVEAGIRVRHNEEQGCPLFSDAVQMQLIVGCDLPELFDIEYREACAAADQDALRRLAGSHLVFGILADSEVSRLPLAQIRELQIHLILVILIVLTGIHLVEHVDQSRKVLLLGRQLIVDIADQGNVEQRFRLHPEVVAAFSFTLGVGDEDGNKLQDILF